MSYDQRKTKREIIECLSDIPFINHAVKKVGITRMTFYRWIRTDEVFERNVNAAIMEGHKNMIEIAESALFKKIKEGHFGAIKLCLEHNGGTYMNRKYRVETISKRNYDDSWNNLSQKMPLWQVYDEEESDQLRRLNEYRRRVNLSDEEFLEMAKMIDDGTFEKYMNEIQGIGPW
jgi:hypothetical protein